MATEVHVSFQIRTLILLGIYAQEWIVGSQDHSIFSFLMTLHPALLSGGAGAVCFTLPPTPCEESAQRQCAPHSMAVLAI